MSIPAPTASLLQPAVEVVELQGEPAKAALADTLSAGLELTPLEQDAWRQKLQRAGLSDNAPSARSVLRAEVTP